MSVTGAFGFYAGLNLIAFVMIFCFVPETKQRTLEELDYIFAIPTRRFLSHQWGTVLPWWISTYVMRRKIGPCPALWSFDGHVDNDEEFIAAARRGSVPEQQRQSSIVGKLANKF